MVRVLPALSPQGPRGSLRLKSRQEGQPRMKCLARCPSHGPLDPEGWATPAQEDPGLRSAAFPASAPCFMPQRKCRKGSRRKTPGRTCSSGNSGSASLRQIRVSRRRQRKRHARVSEPAGRIRPLSGWEEPPECVGRRGAAAGHPQGPPTQAELAQGPGCIFQKRLRWHSPSRGGFAACVGWNRVPPSTRLYLTPWVL